jgi:predicted kinase
VAHLVVDAQTTVSELQFVLARILWAPYCDRERAVLLAQLAAKTHPDPAKRAQIAAWLAERAQPPIDDVALAYLKQVFEKDPGDTFRDLLVTSP